MGGRQIDVAVLVVVVESAYHDVEIRIPVEVGERVLVHAPRSRSSIWPLHGVTPARDMPSRTRRYMLRTIRGVAPPWRIPPMRTSLPAASLLLLAPVALAGDARPDVTVEWVEPTCADAQLQRAAEQRLASVCGATAVETWTYQYRTSAKIKGCAMWLHAWCELPTSVPPFEAPGNVVLPTLYSDKDMRGTALALPTGEYPLLSVPMRDGGDWSRKAGSVRVPQGWTVRLCADLASRCTDLVSDHLDLSKTYVGNDQTNWVSVTKGALPSLLSCPRVFEHDNFKGKHLDVCTDQASLEGSSWNNSISSVLVPAGWTLELCGNTGGAAPCKQVSTEVSRMADTVVGADRTSSLRIVKRP